MSDMPELPRWARWVLYTDVRLVIVVLRPVWWIDHRFHWNNFRQAQAMMMLAMAVHLTGLVMLEIAKLPLFSKAAFIIASLAYANLFWSWWRRLQKASRSYERDPDGITYERAFFYWQTIPPMRLMMLVFGVQLFMAMSVVSFFMSPWQQMRDIGVVLFNSWTLLSAIGLYVASVPPPRRPRKKKEERAPLGALPLPA